MSYSIDYSNFTIKRKTIRFHKIKKYKSRIILLSILMLTLLVICIVPQIRSRLMLVFLPGDSVSTAAAIDKLVHDVENGVTIHTALMDFCRQILEQA